MISKLKKTKIAVVGATGNVGRAILNILSEENFSPSNITALSSSKSLGKKISYGENSILTVQSLDNFNFSSVNIAFFAAGSEVALKYASKVHKSGCLMIDKSSHFRMHKDVPLIIPRVNDETIDKCKLGIIANPNCTTIPLNAVLKPLHDIASLSRIIISTYQSVSGAGKDAMDELYNQTKGIFTNTPTPPKIFQKPIAFNVIPQIDRFCKDGFTKEEHKIMNETKKILGISVDIISTCVRVPVFIGHSLSVVAEFKNNIEVSEVLKALKKTPYIDVIHDIDNEKYITPVECAGDNTIVVSRIRKNVSNHNILSLWICCDNLRKGSALNAIQIAEVAVKKGIIKNL